MMILSVCVHEQIFTIWREKLWPSWKYNLVQTKFMKIFWKQDTVSIWEFKTMSSKPIIVLQERNKKLLPSAEKTFSTNFPTAVSVRSSLTRLHFSPHCECFWLYLICRAQDKWCTTSSFNMFALEKQIVHNEY